MVKDPELWKDMTSVMTDEKAFGFWATLITLILTIATLKIAIVTLLWSFRPIVSYRFEESQEEPTEGLFIPKHSLIITNVGNRPARKIKLFSKRSLGIPDFTLAPGATKTFIQYSDPEIRKITYKRFLNTPFWFTYKDDKEKTWIDRIMNLNSSDSVRTSSGRKKLRKFLKYISNRKYATETLEIKLFALSGNRSKIRLISDNPYSDEIRIDSEYSSSWQEMLFELTKILGKSNVENNDQKGRWVFTSDNLKAAYRKSCRNVIAFDHKDYENEPIPSSEDLYSLFPTNKETDKLLDPINIKIITNDEREVQVGFNTMTIGIEDRIIRFDDFGFIIAKSNKDILISQFIEESFDDTLAFIKDDGVFAADRFKDVKTLELTKEQSEELVKVMEAAKALEDLKKEKKLESLAKWAKNAFSYILWTFKKPYSK